MEQKVDHYTTSLQHILAELARLDLLLRVQVWRVRQQRQEQQAGLAALYIPDEEIDALLDRAVGRPVWAEQPLSDGALEMVQTTLAQMGTETNTCTRESIEQGVYLRLVVLAHLFDLDAFDIDVILLALAPEIDRRYERLYAYLQDDVQRKHPTVDLILSILTPDFADKLAARARFTATAPLLANRLIQIFEDANQRQPSLLGKFVQLDQRIASYLLDDDTLDERLLPYVRLSRDDHNLADVDLDDLLLSDDFKTRLAQLLWRENPGGERPDTSMESSSEFVVTDQPPPLFYFQGPYGIGKARTAAALCNATTNGLLQVDGTLCASLSATEFEATARLLCREVLLQGAALYWEGFDRLLPNAQRADAQAEDAQTAKRKCLLRLLDKHLGLIFLAGAESWEPTNELQNVAFMRIEFPQTTYAMRRATWQELVGQADNDTDNNTEPALDLDALSGTFRLNGGQIGDAATTARNLARWRDPAALQLTNADLYAACRLQSNRKLASLAQKITPHYGWDDIVLPPAQQEQLQAICNQVKYRSQIYDTWGFDQKLSMGKGVSALFSGPPGTGKTMAADILAHELGLDLYKIDLSTMVSKFIGETEKNLARIFNEARTSNAILFFDEADALFGKRTEVKDAHDRYANIETSYLLQKMEEYDGVVILATNFRKNMDEAFMRRLHFTIEFPFPDEAERRRIWTQIWPAATPRSADLDLEFLAERIELAGGNIRNIALASAFLAADNGGQVTMQHLIQATRSEYRKLGKVLTNNAFGEYATL